MASDNGKRHNVHGLFSHDPASPCDVYCARTLHAKGGCRSLFAHCTSLLTIKHFHVRKVWIAMQQLATVQFNGKQPKYTWKDILQLSTIFLLLSCGVGCLRPHQSLVFAFCASASFAISSLFVVMVSLTPTSHLEGVINAYPLLYSLFGWQRASLQSALSSFLVRGCPLTRIVLTSPRSRTMSKDLSRSSQRSFHEKALYLAFLCRSRDYFPRVCLRQLHRSCVGIPCNAEYICASVLSKGAVHTQAHYLFLLLHCESKSISSSHFDIESYPP